MTPTACSVDSVDSVRTSPGAHGGRQQWGRRPEGMRTTEPPVVEPDLRCKRCTRPLNRRTAVQTRAGTYCKRHADALPSHLRRPR